MFAAFGGVTILAYPILWWVMDPAPVGYWDETPEVTDATEAAGDLAEAADDTIDLTETTDKTEQTG